jgi:hypothetical protein
LGKSKAPAQGFSSREKGASGGMTLNAMAMAQGFSSREKRLRLENDAARRPGSRHAASVERSQRQTMRFASLCTFKADVQKNCCSFVTISLYFFMALAAYETGQKGIFCHETTCTAWRRIRQHAHFAAPPPGCIAE